MHTITFKLYIVWFYEHRESLQHVLRLTLLSSQIRQTPTLTVENAVDMGFCPRFTKREATRACFCSTFHSLTSRFFSRMVAGESPLPQPKPKYSRKFKREKKHSNKQNQKKTKNTHKKPHKNTHTNKPTGGCESSPILCYEDENSSNSINFLYIKILSDNLLTTNPILKICLAFILAILSFIV